MRRTRATETDLDPRSNGLRGLTGRRARAHPPAPRPVDLPRPTELEGANEEIRFVYFPTTGVASIVAIDEGGESVDTAMIGREGMTGLRSFWAPASHRSGRSSRSLLTGMRMEAGALREELGRGGRS